MENEKSSHRIFKLIIKTAFENITIFQCILNRKFQTTFTFRSMYKSCFKTVIKAWILRTNEYHQIFVADPNNYFPLRDMYVGAHADLTIKHLKYANPITIKNYKIKTPCFYFKLKRSSSGLTLHQKG